MTVAQRKLSEIGGDPEALPKRRAEIERQVKALQESIARTPEVEGGLNALLREYDNLKTDYRLAQGKNNVAATGEQSKTNATPAPTHTRDDRPNDQPRSRSTRRTSISG